MTIDDASGPVTIDVTGPQSAGLTSNVAFGNATAGAIQLNVTGAGTGSGSNYTLALSGGVTLTGANTNYVFDVAADRTGSGTGTLVIGGLNGGGTARTVTLQNAGTVAAHRRWNAGRGLDGQCRACRRRQRRQPAA